MPKILHYISDTVESPIRFRGRMETVSEYIVITEDDDQDPADFGRDGFHFSGAEELDDTGILPTERVLIPAD